jgi:hypothetical protein
MQQLTETINYARNNCRHLSNLGFTKFPTKYARTFTEPESGYVVDCTVGLSKTRRGYSLGSLSMRWPTNPLILDYIPIESLHEILGLVYKLYGIYDRITFCETDDCSKTVTLDEFRKLKLQPEKLSYLDFYSRKIVQPSKNIRIGPGHKRKLEWFEKTKVLFVYNGKEVETAKRYREISRDSRQKIGIDNSEKKTENPSWSAYLRVKNPQKQDLELITQIFDITVRSADS